MFPQEVQSHLVFDKHPTLIPGRQRLSVFVGLVLLSLVLTQFVELPARPVEISVFGSPLGFELSSGWLMAILLASLACTGTDALVRTHPRARQVSLRHTFVYWIQPGLLGLTAARLLALASTRPLWIAGLIITGLLFVGVLIAEYTTVDPLAPAYSQARLLLNVIAYALAFALFVIVYQTRSRSLVTATAMLVISFALALDLLWSARVARGAGHTTMLAATVGLIVGECSWAMNYWQTSEWSGGMLLLLIFYMMTGIASQHLQGRLSRPVLIEFVVVAIMGIAVLLIFHP
jgi:Protein of unknown function (DUF5656)